MFKSLSLSVLGLAAITSASAALSVTNGNFETGTGTNIANITGWFDYNFDGTNTNFFHAGWSTNTAAITPNGTGVIVLGSNDNSATTQSTTSTDVLNGSYIYQSIGTADGATQLTVNFDFGTPDDDAGGRTLGMSVAIYAYDGVGTFSAADNTNIRSAFLGGGSGLSLLDSDSSSTIVSTGIDDQISAHSVTLDISGAGSQTLLLAFNNYRPANTQSWSVLDNVSITAIPEPSTYALFAGVGALVLVTSRRSARKS